MRALSDLWAGRLPLAAAFWTWAVLVGIAVNGLATAGTLAVLAADLPAALAVSVHLLPVPYNVACVVGVWRSAGRYGGPTYWAEAARIGVLVWAVAATAL